MGPAGVGDEPHAVDVGDGVVRCGEGCMGGEFCMGREGCMRGESSGVHGAAGAGGTHAGSAGST